jgi:hypothetical protein
LNITSEVAGDAIAFLCVVVILGKRKPFEVLSNCPIAEAFIEPLPAKKPLAFLVGFCEKQKVVISKNKISFFI